MSPEYPDEPWTDDILLPGGHQTIGESRAEAQVPQLVTSREALLWAFEHLYHQDCANAKMHCAPVRFSPLTFRLAEALADGWNYNVDWTQELAHVMHDKGAYDEDPGR